MKVIGISTKKSIQDGTGVHRVTVKYVIGTRSQKVRTAHLLYDWFADTARLADQCEQAANRAAADALCDFVQAYFKLKFYGWEE